MFTVMLDSAAMFDNRSVVHWWLLTGKMCTLIIGNLVDMYTDGW